MTPIMQTPRNISSLLCSAVLLLLIIKLPSCFTSKIDFFDEKNFITHLYGTDNVPNPAECQNLAYFVRGRASSIKTKVCVYVYLSEDCQGDPCKLTPGDYANLLALDNRGVSFRACDTPGEKHEEKARVRLFAEPDYKNLAVDDPLPKDCETLHRSLWNVTSSIMTTECVVLFDDEACTGNLMYQTIGNAAKLPLMDNVVKSFRPCLQSEISTQSVAFFGDQNFQIHLYTTEKIPPPSSCQTLPYWMQSGVFSMKTSVCVSLFHDEDCQGNEFEVPAGEYKALPELDKWVKSYRACDNFRTGRDMKFYVEYRVKLYNKEGFVDLLLDETITPECQSLHESLWDQTSSVITSTCVVLYSNPDCSGGQTTRVMQNLTMLPEFVKLKSFRPCDPDQLYGEAQLSGKIIKFEINADESETDKKSVTDYVEMTQKTRFRNDGPATQTQRYESHKVTKDKVEIDVITNLMQMTELRVTDTVSQDFTKQFGKSLNKGFKKLANLRGSAAGFKSYQKGKTDTDTKEKMKGDTVETGGSVTSALFSSRNNATTETEGNPPNQLNWTDGLGSIGPIVNTGPSSRRTRVRPQALPFETAIGDGNAAATIATTGEEQKQDSFQAYLQGTLNKQDAQTLETRLGSADAKDKRKTKEKMWMGQKEIGGEFTGAQAEQKEMQDKIGAALVTGYQGSSQNQSSFSNKITKEEEKGFTVDQTISIPPCTEYEVTSFVKRTKNFPAEYSVFVEVTGKWGKTGPAMTNEEIGRKLGGMEVVTWKDKHTVVVMGTASLVVDFSWFSVWNGKGTRIPGCDDGTKAKSSEEKNENVKSQNTVELYDWPYLSGLLYKDDIKDDCQVIPSHVMNKVESIYTTSCIILFPNPKCQLVDARNSRNIGYTLKVHPDHGITLPSYENVAQSYQSCASFEKKLIYDRNKIKFYGKDTKAPLLSAPVAQSCSNLPKRTRRMITSVVVDNCVTLFSEGDCKGENFTVRPHSGVRLWDHFGGKAESFRSCASYADETLLGYANYNNSNSKVLGNDRVRMFEDEQHSELVLDEPLRSTCVTLSKVDWGKTRYIKTDKCITIYTQPLCQGQGVEVVPEFSKYVFYIPFASFAPCEKVETDEHNEVKRILWSGNLV